MKTFNPKIRFGGWAIPKSNENNATVAAAAAAVANMQNVAHINDGKIKIRVKKVAGSLYKYTKGIPAPIMVYCINIY